MSDRKTKVANLVQEQAAKYIAAEANTDPMITVTRVDVSADLHNATIFITTIPDERSEDALIFLKRHGRDMRRRIMKFANMKVIPSLEFSVDYGEKHRQHIDDIVREEGIESTYENLREKE